MTAAIQPVSPADPIAFKAPAGDLGTAAAAAGQELSPDLRLVIEEDADTGQFVYKTMDRSTGEVVRQFPRDELLRKAAEDSYAAGLVVDAKV